MNWIQDIPVPSLVNKSSANLNLQNILENQVIENNQMGSALK